VIDQAFGSLPRPKTMLCNPNHCDECVEHEATMQAHTPQTISLEEIGNLGWDPVCYISDEAYCYFMPGFARLVLDDDALYTDQFLFHLDSGFRTDTFNPEQRRAVAQIIEYLGTTILDERTSDILKAEWNRVRDRLSKV
jgi:hypothetical protein